MFSDTSGGHVELWIEPTDDDEQVGIVLGCGDNLATAITSAREALATLARQLDQLEQDAPPEDELAARRARTYRPLRPRKS